jgi:hypothetical protein
LLFKKPVSSGFFEAGGNPHFPRGYWQVFVLLNNLKANS